MSRFITRDSKGITFNYENRIARLVKKLHPDNGVEFMVGALASICTPEQMGAFAMELEEKAAMK